MRGAASYGCGWSGVTARGRTGAARVGFMAGSNAGRRNGAGAARGQGERVEQGQSSMTGDETGGNGNDGRERFFPEWVGC